jgi:hypothetical protein
MAVFPGLWKSVKIKKHPCGLRRDAYQMIVELLRKLSSQAYFHQHRVL